MYRDSEIGVVFHHGVLSRSAFALRLAQLVSALFVLVYGALVARFLLVYVQAAQSPFVYWINRVTDPVFRPIQLLIANGRDAAGHPVAWAILIAIGASAVLQWSVVAMLRGVARPRLDDD
jgi:uncharacterized protein YggT (Ycf19 family)